MNSDSPIVEEVRQRALEISARFNHDLAAYAEHLKQLQEKHHSRVVNQVTVTTRRPAGVAEKG